ncbi:hypothetical protein [Deinococcus hohokamensis]|uniref:Uncharacterized protein n=1 Tax=Deinococcus hohokamensis TaxID=309883 RepID=A0ABV9I546_9DEIO
MSFSPPNYTQTPNELFALLPVMKEAELRVTLVIVRATFGWNVGGHAAHLSLQMLMDDTGLSKQGVMNGINAGKERGTIVTVKEGKEVYYGLSVRDVEVPVLGQRSRPKTVNLVDPTEEAKGQRSRPKRSSTSTQTVNLVDSQGQPSGPNVGDLPAPSGQETDAQRQQTDRKDNERQTAGSETPVGTPPIAAAGQPEREDEQTPGAGRAGTPAGVTGADAQPTSDAQVQASGETHGATSTEQIPGGAALAALTAALAPMKPVELMAEYEGRKFWLEIAPDRIRELHGDLRAEHGGRKYRGALIDALDAEARQIRLARAPQAPTKTNVSDLVRSRIGVRK